MEVWSSFPENPSEKRQMRFQLFIPLMMIYKVYFFLVFASSLIIFFPLEYYLLSHEKRFSNAFEVMRFHSLFILILTGIVLNVKGKENIPNKGAFIMCSNHSSFLDPFCVYSIVSKYFVFIGKREIEKWPLFHIFYTSGMNILVDRNNRSDSFKAIKRMSKEIEMGNSLMIFPEGTRSSIAPKLQPFKLGAFAIAIQKQVPILPITFVNNWKLLQKGGFWKGMAMPGIAEVVIHKPISTDNYKKEDIAQVSDLIKRIIGGPLKYNAK